ncbi:hypothetical protein IH799_09470 [candidate division KSB1 bacterium]|nr:hypothetical protein [candidate division KSB1 bacterium]
MTPGKTTIQLLKNYLGKQNSNDAGYQFSCDLKGLKIQINVKEFDKFSFIVETLRIERSDDLQSGSDFLRKQADFLKSNLTYLLDNIEVFEIDSLQSKAQLRSRIPEENDSSLSYFEIMIEGRRGVALERVVFDKQKKQRKNATFHLTHETLTRTIDDFVKAIELTQ